MRNYESIPRPEIEHHYHIRDLFEFQEKRSTDRTFHRDRIKALEEREKDICDSKVICLIDFWCKLCKKDFKAQSVKQVEIDWSNSTQRIAFYKNKCFKGHWCIRLITDQIKDGFWQHSKFVALDRGNHHSDTIQPFESGFNLLYGKR